jgi:hypothetical protein
MQSIPIYPVTTNTEGTDPGYMCLAGILNLPSEKEAREAINPKNKEDNSPFTPYTVKDLLKKSKLLYTEITAETSNKKVGTQELPWTNPFWFSTAQREISDGNVLLCFMRFFKSAPKEPGPAQQLASTHTVLITGWRKEQVQESDPEQIALGITSRVEEQLQVRCPKLGEYWVYWAELLYWHGLTAIPIRPVNR